MSHLIEKWEPIFAQFDRYYPHITDVMIDWYPSGRNEITARLKNGDTVVYNVVSNRVRKTYDSRNDSEEFDEQLWRDEFAKRLSNKMGSIGMPQWKLSEMSGISEVSLSKYLNAKATPSGYNIDRICCALDCSGSELIDIL